MELSDILFFMLYGGAFILIIHFISRRIYKPAPSTVVIYDQTPVYRESVWWPWANGSYNAWPYWAGWWSGGGDGGYGRRWGGGRPWGHRSGRGGHRGIR